MSEYETTFESGDESIVPAKPRLLEQMARKLVLQRLAGIDNGELTLHDEHGKYVFGRAGERFGLADLRLTSPILAFTAISRWVVRSVPPKRTCKVSGLATI